MDIRDKWWLQNISFRHAGSGIWLQLNRHMHVMIMDAANFARFKAGEAFEILGGLNRDFEAHWQLPHTAEWHTLVAYDGDRFTYSIDLLTPAWFGP